MHRAVDLFILALFFDDGLFAGITIKLFSQVAADLTREFECRFGDGSKIVFIGLHIEHDLERQTTSIISFVRNQPS